MSAPGPRWTEVAKTSDPEHLGNLRRAYEAGRKDAREKAVPTQIRLATPQEMAERARELLTPVKAGPAWEALQPAAPLMVARAFYEAGLRDAAAKVRQYHPHLEALVQEIEP